ncbi:MAG: hypothetical protein HN725_07840 [Alphaproteobacteria bacterium]|jgi:hypothetical protein|nr:hypothetical protein [Alphaproteobacteria bacterium]MBT4082771.1 hypothetical protein [Alphaproteobacteria bacterium]MBT4544000.1 hypothetical protein [Alphaproteobacteria bacterium]MBT7745187.1 hypothetical protein [Alphaproteobacteria bacterium]
MTNAIEISTGNPLVDLVIRLLASGLLLILAAAVLAQTEALQGRASAPMYIVVGLIAVMAVAALVQKYKTEQSAAA